MNKNLTKKEKVVRAIVVVQRVTSFIMPILKLICVVGLAWLMMMVVPYVNGDKVFDNPMSTSQLQGMLLLAVILTMMMMLIGKKVAK